MIFCKERGNIKILTLNTHSLMEKEDVQDVFVSAIKKELPDIIALQEVNQTIGKDKAFVNNEFCFPLQDSEIKEDNYALNVIKKLSDAGCKYFWTWLKIKKSYDKFEEGLAFLSRYPIEKTDTVLLSKTCDFNNWKKRMALGVKIGDAWFYNVHMGWFDDEEEPFSSQWEKLQLALSDKKNVFLMGDFNCDAKIKGEGYSLVLNSDFYDLYMLAEEKDDGVTVMGEIDGWKNQERKRIDYVFSRKNIKVKSSYVVFNGENFPVVSDHFGVLTEI